MYIYVYTYIHIVQKMYDLLCKLWKQGNKSRISLLYINICLHIYTQTCPDFSFSERLFGFQVARSRRRLDVMFLYEVV